MKRHDDFIVPVLAYWHLRDDINDFGIISSIYTILVSFDYIFRAVITGPFYLHSKLRYIDNRFQRCALSFKIEDCVRIVRKVVLLSRMKNLRPGIYYISGRDGYNGK